MAPTCHPSRRLFARGLCQSCYLRLREQERPIEAARRAAGIRLCSRCGEEKPIGQFSKGAGRCKPCRVVGTKAYVDAHRDDPRFIETRRRNNLAMARKHGRARHLRRFYDLSLDDYQTLLNEQGGLCAICRQPPAPGRVLAVDHDHTTGRRRGLLCDPCNHGIGSLGDDPDRLRAAIEYLSRFPS